MECKVPSPFGARPALRAVIDMRLQSRTTVFVLAAIAVACAACANLLHGKTEEISVESDPPGATVVLSNGMSGVTPFMIQVPRERDLVFHFSKDGYRPSAVVDDTKVEGKYIAADWASMLVTGLPFAWVSDVSSGAAHTHEQLAITAQLEPDPSYVPRPTPTPTPTPMATPTPLMAPSDAHTPAEPQE